MMTASGVKYYSKAAYDIDPVRIPHKYYLKSLYPPSRLMSSSPEYKSIPPELRAARAE